MRTSKRRLRKATDAGTDIAVDLPRGSYLTDGAVLHDDGERLVIAQRTPEPALVVRFDAAAPAERLVSQAFALGYAFGNRHVPVEVERGEAGIPLTTGEDVARRTVQALGLDVVRVEIASVALGRDRPLLVGHAQSSDEARSRDHDPDHDHHSHDRAR
jgi:urease accessory protein